MDKTLAIIFFILGMFIMFAGHQVKPDIREVDCVIIGLLCIINANILYGRDN